MSGYRIERARLSDVPACRRIEARAATRFVETRHAYLVGGRTTRVSSLLRGLLGGHLWVARTPEGRPVGFVLCSRRDGSLYVDELAVVPEHGRRGLGRGLIAKAVETARGAGLEAVTLTTFADVAWNAPFYRSLGFEDWATADLPPEHAEIARRHERSGLDMRDRLFMRFPLGDREATSPAAR